MYKIFYKISLAILLMSFFPAFAVEASDISVEFRSAAFFHSSGRFREIYGNVGTSYQLEASTPLYNCMDGWTNFDWFSKHNSGGCSSRVSIASVSFGIKYPYRICGLITYIGIGPSISRIWLKNKPEDAEQERTSKLVLGGVLKTGINYFITRDIYLDLFLDYLYQPVHFDTWVDIGGLKTGLGIGIQF